MHQRFLLLSTAALTLALAAGCSKKDTTDSSDVTTHGMSMDLSAYSDGSSTTVTATLHVGDSNSNDSVRLTNGETLVLHATPTNITLNEHDDSAPGGTIVRYNTILNGTSSGTFVVDFNRASGAVSALGNSVTLPPPFNLTAPTGTLSRKSSVTLNWDAPGNGYAITVTLDGSCIMHAQKSVVGDPGNFVINGGELTALSGHETEVCPVSVVVERRIQTNSNFSSAFWKLCGSDAKQYRSATFQSGP